MAKNDFKAFAIGNNANVVSQEEYEELTALVGGFSSGVALSPQLNKVWRQSSVISTVLAEFVASQSGDDVLDNGDLALLKKSLESALRKFLIENSDPRYFKVESNFSELQDKGKARNNLDVYSKSESSQRYVNRNGDTIPGRLHIQNSLDVDNNIGVGPAILQTDGNIKGSIWNGGYLSDFIASSISSSQRWVTDNFPTTNYVNQQLQSIRDWVSSNFVSDVQLGSPVTIYKGAGSNVYTAPAGHIFSSIDVGDSNQDRLTAVVRPIQKKVNGTYYTVTQI